MPSGTIIIKEQKTDSTGAAALYARVSSHDQKNDLDAQIGRLSQFAASQKLAVTMAVTEIGSGLNGHWPKLMKLLANPAVSIIVVEHRDRLMRFGSEYVRKYWRRSKESGVRARTDGLSSRRRPLQGSTGSAESQHESLHGMTVLTSWPPADACGSLDIGKASGVLPSSKKALV